MAKFSVGEIAIIQNIPLGTIGYEFNGRYCTIKQLPGSNSMWPDRYGVSIQGAIAPIFGHHWYALEEHLKKIKPDDDSKDKNTDTPKNTNVPCDPEFLHDFKKMIKFKEETV